jgi:hypothetical protein
MVALRVGRGIGDFAEGRACANVSRAKNPGLCVLTACAGWPVRKEAFCQQAFWVLCGYKVTAHPRRLSGTDINKRTDYCNSTNL